MNEEKYNKLLSFSAKLLEELTAFEFLFNEYADEDQCPWCGQNSRKGHSNNCEFINFIKEAKELGIEVKKNS